MRTYEHKSKRAWELTSMRVYENKNLQACWLTSIYGVLQASVFTSVRFKSMGTYKHEGLKAWGLQVWRLQARGFTSIGAYKHGINKHRGLQAWRLQGWISGALYNDRRCELIREFTAMWIFKMNKFFGRFCVASGRILPRTGIYRTSIKGCNLDMKKYYKWA